jgi:molecular chaperone DnaK (HSP70)
MADRTAIGIDLGAAHSRVAVFRNHVLEIIASDVSGRSMPACVAFTTADHNELPLLIGDAARTQAHSNINNTVFAAKFLLGRRFDDPIVRHANGERSHATFKGTLDKRHLSPSRILETTLHRQSQVRFRFGSLVQATV